MTSKTGRLVSRSDHTITVEWDGVYGGKGSVVSVDGVDYTVVCVTYRGPDAAGKFVSQGSLPTEATLAAEREAKRAESLVSARLRHIDD